MTTSHLKESFGAMSIVNNVNIVNNRVVRRGDEGLTVQQVATCVRVSLWLWGGHVGPGWSQLNVDTIFVRDEAFLLSLAAEIRVDAGELFRVDREASVEAGEKRRARGEALRVAEIVCGLVARLRKNHGDRWGFFEKMVKGQTLTQVSRSVKRIDRGLARASCAWCAGRFREVIGDVELERLLTFRDHVG